jgi:hypothetical protein
MVKVEPRPGSLWTVMNGVLMFDWSTAVIFEVLRRVVRSGVEAGNDGSGANE